MLHEPEMNPILIAAAVALKGSPRRLFMAKTVKAMGRGGQRWALKHLSRPYSRRPNPPPLRRWSFSDGVASVT